MAVILGCAILVTSCEDHQGSLYAPCQTTDECLKGLECIVSSAGGNGMCTIRCAADVDPTLVGSCMAYATCEPGCCHLNTVTAVDVTGYCVPYI